MQEKLAKANELSENLRKEVETERTSGAALQTQVKMLQKRLDNARDAGLAASAIYTDVLKRYGGVAPALPTEPSAFNMMQWMRSSFSRLPDF